MSQRERLEPPALSPLERHLLLNATAETSRPNIQPVPPSSVLSKVRGFLPQMQRANEQLAQQLLSSDASAVDIEHIPEGTNAPVIQMDLACGLLDLKDDAALAAAQRAITAGGEVAVETNDGGSSSDDSSDDEDSSGEIAAANQRETGAAGIPEDGTAAGAARQQAAATAAGASSASSLRQQQGSSRRKVKAKRPMIVEI